MGINYTQQFAGQRSMSIIYVELKLEDSLRVIQISNTNIKCFCSSSEAIDKKCCQRHSVLGGCLPLRSRKTCTNWRHKLGLGLGMGIRRMVDGEMKQMG